MGYRTYKPIPISCIWDFTRDGGGTPAVGMDVFFVPGDIYIGGRMTVLEAVTGPPGSALQFLTVTEANILGTSGGTPMAAGVIFFANGIFTYQQQQEINLQAVLGPLTAGRVLFEGTVKRLAAGDQI